jgi:hypothetical protein
MMVRDETVLGKIVHCAECAGEFEAMGMFEALGVERGVVADSQVHLTSEYRHVLGLAMTSILADALRIA